MTSYIAMVKKRKLRWHGHEDNSAKDQEGEEDRRRDGKITSKNGQEWRFPEGSGRQKDGKVLLQRHQRCPEDH